MPLFVKTPTEVLDYDQDYSDVLVTSEEIDSSDWAITEPEDATVPPLVIDSSEFTTSASKVWLSGGLVGVEYYLQNTVTTNQGRTYTRGFNLQLAEERE